MGALGCGNDVVQSGRLFCNGVRWSVRYCGLLLDYMDVQLMRYSL